MALWHAVLNMASATRATEDVAAASVAVIVWAILILRAESRRLSLGVPASSGPWPGRAP